MELARVTLSMEPPGKSKVLYFCKYLRYLRGFYHFSLAWHGNVNSRDFYEFLNENVHTQFTYEILNNVFPTFIKSSTYLVHVC